MLQKLRSRWHVAGGYKELLIISIPLILSMGSWSIMQFVDRMFLAWYDTNALAAAMPASMANWTISSLFIGMAAYVSTFVAQYLGAETPHRIGPSMWQGIWLSVFTLPAMLPVYLGADLFFAAFDHTVSVQKMEIEYFRILLYGTPLLVVNTAISNLFSGLGKTMIVMWINLVGTVLNVLLDYGMIFGYWGFPEMGIVGAGWATIISTAILTLVSVAVVSRPKWNSMYRTLSGWRFDRDLFRRLIRYGFPSGFQWLLEIAAFTFFLLLLGEFGTSELAASTIAFNINMLAFLPMAGLQLGLIVLVGQRLGENESAIAEKTTWSAFHLAFIFFAFLGLTYFLVPEIYIALFETEENAEKFTAIRYYGEIFLRFVAFYSLFDAGLMIFSGTLKGAGDTLFVALITTGVSWGLMVIPSYLVASGDYGNVFWLWGFLTLYVCVLCVVFWRRFVNGKWQAMRVIENNP